MVIKFFLVLLSLSLFACGFQFQGSGSILPSSVKTIYIKEVVNNSTDSQAGLLLYEALSDRFNRYGTIQVVDSEINADAVLETEIFKFEQQAVSVTSSTDMSLQQDSILSLSAELLLTSGGTLWSNPKIVLSKAYGSTANSVVASSPEFSAGGLNTSDLNSLSDREVARSQEGQALEDLTELAAKKIYEQAVLPEF